MCLLEATWKAHRTEWADKLWGAPASSGAQGLWHTWHAHAYINMIIGYVIIHTYIHTYIHEASPMPWAVL